MGENLFDRLISIILMPLFRCQRRPERLQIRVVERQRAEFSVDAADWKYIDPSDQLSDAKTEDYDFKVAPPAEAEKDAVPEHVVVVRVYDKYDNMGAAKTVLHAK